MIVVIDSKKLEELTKERYMSRTELAQKSGISAWTLRTFFSSRFKRVYPDTALKLAAALDVVPDEFTASVPDMQQYLAKLEEKAAEDPGSESSEKASKDAAVVAGIIKKLAGMEVE